MPVQTNYTLEVHEDVVFNGSSQHEELLDSIAEMNALWQKEDIGENPVGKNINIKRVEEEVLREETRLSPQTYIVARDITTGEIAGYGRLDSPRRNIYTFSLGFVKKEHRQRHIFGDIIDTACQLAETKGYAHLIALPTNEYSIRAFAKRGFIVSNEQTTFGHKEFHMVKQFGSHAPEGQPRGILGWWRRR